MTPQCHDMMIPHAPPHKIPGFILVLTATLGRFQDHISLEAISSAFFKMPRMWRTKIVCETLTARTVQESFDQQMPCEILERDGRCRVRQSNTERASLEHVLLLVGITNALCAPKMVWYGSAPKTFPNISANRNHSIYGVSFPKSALLRFQWAWNTNTPCSNCLRQMAPPKKSQQQPPRNNHWSLISRDSRTGLHWFHEKTRVWTEVDYA